VKPFQVALSVIPVVIIAIGLIGWVLTLRNDVTTTVQQVDGFQEELSSVHERIDNSVVLVGDAAEGVNVRIDDEMNDVQATIDGLRERLAELETALAVASDQMQTIMGDHMGFADTLKELGESGALPSGERRAYGGYGD
jgi:chromosome segregation ATPase